MMMQAEDASKVIIKLKEGFYLSTRFQEEELIIKYKGDDNFEVRESIFMEDSRKEILDTNALEAYLMKRFVNYEQVLKLLKEEE